MLAQETVIQAEGLGFSFGGSPVIDSLSFSLRRGSFMSFLGPSGCGKTTLLNLVAGIYRPGAGRLDVRTRRVSFVFQNEALLPWRSTLDNVLLPFELEGRAVTVEERARGLRILSELGLEGSEGLFPSQLSGGMKKRVELARALVTEPELLILDEPFSSLDIITRERLNTLLRGLHHRTGCSIVLVTHSVEEACFLSDSILVLSARPAQVIDVVDLGKNGQEMQGEGGRREMPRERGRDAPPDQYLLSPRELAAAAGIRRSAAFLWTGGGDAPAPAARARLMGRAARTAAPARAAVRAQPAPTRDWRSFLRDNYGWILIPAELVALYFLLAFLKGAIPIPDYILPHPRGLMARFFTTLGDGSILADLGMTVYESLAGFAVAFVLTLLLGYGIAKSRLASRLLMPYLIASNTIPTIAFAPFLVLWFGFGVTPRVITSVICIFFPMLINTISAMGIAERSMGQLISFFRPGRWSRFTRFELPAALPVIASGVKVSITLSVIGAVVGEFVSGSRGLGALVSVAKGNFDVELMYVALIWLVLLGLAYYAMASAAYRWAVRKIR
jgi:NitT/TauT family transport system ATP-binding protein